MSHIARKLGNLDSEVVNPMPVNSPKGLMSLFIVLLRKKNANISENPRIRVSVLFEIILLVLKE